MKNYSRLFRLIGEEKLQKAKKTSFDLENEIKKIIHSGFTNIFANNLILLTRLKEPFTI